MTSDRDIPERRLKHSSFVPYINFPHNETILKYIIMMNASRLLDRNGDKK